MVGIALHAEPYLEGAAPRVSLRLQNFLARRPERRQRIIRAVGTAVLILACFQAWDDQYMMGQRRFLAPDEPPVEELVDLAFLPSPEEYKKRILPLAGKAFAIGAREIDARVLVQQGAFTVHADAADTSELDYVSVPPWRLAFVVPSAAKNDLRELLRALGVHQGALFPDLGALAEELKSRHMLGQR